MSTWALRFMRREMRVMEFTKLGPLS